MKQFRIPAITFIFLVIIFGLFSLFYLQDIYIKQKQDEKQNLPLDLENRLVVNEKIPENETISWQGKTTDWLDRTYDINNSGNEFIDPDWKVATSTGWTKPKQPSVIDNGTLQQVAMNDGKNWESIEYSNSKASLETSELTSLQREYFYKYYYVPRLIEQFDVTGDNVTETVVTSTNLGCGRCVSFFMSIFLDQQIFNMGTDEGTILKTESGNGFYLINDTYDKNSRNLLIRKYKWDGNMFIEIAIKEVLLVQRKKLVQVNSISCFYSINRQNFLHS